MLSLQAATPNTGTLSIWWYGAAGLHQAHRMWKWITLGQTYGNSDNWLGLSLGHVLDCHISNTFFSRFPFVAFLVGKRFLDLMQQKDSVEKTFGDWKSALQGIHPVYLFEKNHPTTEGVISIKSLHITWIHVSKTLLIRVERVALTTLQLTGETFKLVMRSMDILEFVSFDRQQYEELLRISVQQAPLNILHCMEALNRNEDVFMQRLEKEKAAIDKGLQYLGVSISSSDVIKNVGTFFEWSKSAQKGYKTVSSLFGDAATDLFKLIIQSVVSDDLKPTVNQALKFDPNNNYWSDNAKRMRYVFPDDASVTKSWIPRGPHSDMLNAAFSRNSKKETSAAPTVKAYPPIYEFYNKKPAPVEPLTDYAVPS